MSNVYRDRSADSNAIPTFNINNNTSNNNGNTVNKSTNIVNFIDNLNITKNLSDSDEGSKLFKKKIDKLNLKFYIETEKYLNNTHDMQKCQDQLFIILFKEISLYIEEVERLNIIARELQLQVNTKKDSSDKVSSNIQLANIKVDNKNLEKKLNDKYNDEIKLKKEIESLKREIKLLQEKLQLEILVKKGTNEVANTKKGLNANELSKSNKEKDFSSTLSGFSVNNLKGDLSTKKSSKNYNKKENTNNTNNTNNSQNNYSKGENKEGQLENLKNKSTNLSMTNLQNTKKSKVEINVDNNINNNVKLNFNNTVKNFNIKDKGISSTGFNPVTNCNSSIDNEFNNYSTNTNFNNSITNWNNNNNNMAKNTSKILNKKRNYSDNNPNANVLATKNLQLNSNNHQTREVTKSSSTHKTITIDIKSPSKTTLITKTFVSKVIDTSSVGNSNISLNNNSNNQNQGMKKKQDSTVFKNVRFFPFYLTVIYIYNSKFI